MANTTITENTKTLKFKTKHGVETWTLTSVKFRNSDILFEGRPTWRKTRKDHSRSIVKGSLLNWNEGRNEGPVEILAAA